jgi:hypothetical protein
MNSWHSYPSIFNMGHRAINNLLDGPVNVEEKVDGSQFSFGCFYDENDEVGSRIPELKIKSKGAMIYPEAPPKLFANAVNTVRELFAAGKLIPGFTYRGEALQSKKHNALTYDRVPTGNIIIFDVNFQEEAYLTYEAKKAAAEMLGLECVPLLYSGMVHNVTEFRAFLDRESILGGQKIEGVVVKPVNYDLFGQDKKVLFGKFVSEHFREVHKHTWGESNPTRGDVIEKLIEELSTPARYQKAVIHLRERGLITDNVKDIGLIIGEVRKDITKEEHDYIAQKLYRHFADGIIRRAASGVPQWWKDRLLEQAFEQAPPEPDAPSPCAETPWAETALLRMLDHD